MYSIRLNDGKTVQKHIKVMTEIFESLAVIGDPVTEEQLHATERLESKESIWHRRYGHLREQKLQKLARRMLVDKFHFDSSKQIGFCKTCVGGKHHRSQFPTGEHTCAKELLGFVHSDVCSKINTRSIGGAEYFLTFTDDKSHCTWVYPLKYKHEVFDCFVVWKALVEKSSGQKLKVLRTDNGGEYTSAKFETYMKSEGIRHEYTVPKTPEQNGVAERLNRTLIENVRSMLIDSKMPHNFWAEALCTAVAIFEKQKSNKSYMSKE